VICGRQRTLGQVLLQVLLFTLSNIIPPILHNHLSVMKGTNNWHISAVPRDVMELITDNTSADEEKQRNASEALAHICLIVS